MSEQIRRPPKSGRLRKSETLAVVVLAKDEEENITECLQSVSWADRLCVLLDPSTVDRTAELALQAGAEVQEHEFVSFADQRNAALEMYEAEWVFFVDADERGTPELGAEVRRAVEGEAAAGWWVPRRAGIRITSCACSEEALRTMIPHVRSTRLLSWMDRKPTFRTR